MAEERKRNPYPFVLASEVKLREQGRYIVKDVARVDETVIWYGQPKSNKSTVVEDMLLHVAMGWDWMGHKVPRPGLCIFIAAERAEITEARLLAFRKRHGIDPETEIPFVIIDQRPNMKREEDRDRLADTIEDIERHFDMDVSIIAIDTLTQTFGPGSQNSDEEMASYGRGCVELRRFFSNCHLIIIHHERKVSQGEDKAGNGPKGATDLLGIVEGAIQVRVEGDPEERYREVHVYAHNAMQAGFLMSFSFEPVHIGKHVDPETEEETEVFDVVAFAVDRKEGGQSPRSGEKDAEKNSPQVQSDAMEILDIIEEVTNDRKDKADRDGKDYHPGNDLVGRELIKEIFEGRYHGVTMQRNRFKRAIDKALRMKIIGSGIYDKTSYRSLKNKENLD